jgi:hypothetical protein
MIRPAGAVSVVAAVPRRGLTGGQCRVAEFPARGRRGGDGGVAVVRGGSSGRGGRDRRVTTAAASRPVVRREADGRTGPAATGHDEAGPTGVRIRRRRSVTVRGHRRRQRRRMAMGSGRLVLGGDGGRMGMVDGPDVFQNERRPELFRRIVPLLLSRRRRSLVGVVVVAAGRGLDALLVVRLGGGAVGAGHAIGGREDRGIAAAAVVPVVGWIAVAHVALLTRFDPGVVVLARRRRRRRRGRLRFAHRQRRMVSAIAIAATGRRHGLKHVYVGCCYESFLILHPLGLLMHLPFPIVGGL